ncbi:MAG: hypothetical protein Q4E91_12530 [Lachnospiraceae bacterium]|nr:hypothetical protein [Lachnospiraceae bacterium]
MAHIGMRYPVFAPLNEEGDDYEAGFVIGKAISYTGTPANNDTKLWADDEIAETDTSIQNEGVSLNVDEIGLKVYANLLGHTYTAAGTGENPTPETVSVKLDDVAPFGGLGFYRRRKKNGVITYTTLWLYKVQFSEPTTEGATKADTVTFQTNTITGTAYHRSDGELKDMASFTSEEAAKAWLETKAKITGA